MRKHTITDAEAHALLSGATPQGRPELTGLADSIADARRAAQHVVPQPSAALVARLERPSLGVSDVPEREPAKGITKVFATMSGLGIAAKVAAAGGVLALGLAGAGAAGAAGVLPGPAQDAFNEVVMTFVPADDETDGTGATDECVVDEGAAEGVDEGTVECADVEPALPVGSKEFSEWVQHGAKDPNKVGSEFGESVSEQARELRDEMAGDRPDNNGGHGQGGDSHRDDDIAPGGGKPEGTPGGRP